MAFPWRVGIAASNQPTGAQNFEHGTTALSGHRAPASVLTSGKAYMLLAISGTTWEIYTAAVWTDSTTDYFTRAGDHSSSTGSAIDWSATGVNLTPDLYVLGESGNEKAPRQVLSTTITSDAYVELTMAASCAYLVLFAGVKTATDGSGSQWIGVRVGVGGVDSGATDYGWHNMWQGGTSAPSGTGSAGAAEMRWLTANTGNASAREWYSGSFLVTAAGDASAYTTITGTLGADTYTGVSDFTVTFGGRRMAAQADDTLRILAGTGDLERGHVSAWEYPQ
jgi:hypothetical protein